MSDWLGIEAEARSAAKAGVDGWDGAGDFGHMRAMRAFARRCIAHGVRLAKRPEEYGTWQGFADAIERGEVEV